MVDTNEEFVSSEYHYSVGGGDLVVGEVVIPKEVQMDSAYLIEKVVKRITDDLKQQGKIVRRADQPVVAIKNSSVSDIFVTGSFDPFTLQVYDADAPIPLLKDH